MEVKKTRVALVQLSTNCCPQENLTSFKTEILRAIRGGAKFILTPEVTNFLTSDHQFRLANACVDDNDFFIKSAKHFCYNYNVWILIGSLVYKVGETGKCVNRSILIGPTGEIAAQYDKIHMFDVNLGPDQTFKESDYYQPGSKSVLVGTDIGTIGMTICYDLRFPSLYTKLASKGANIIVVPSAFTKFTGELHWQILLQARAIETGCFILAPAQCGLHKGTNRESYGHSMIISPQGQVISSLGSEPGICIGDINIEECLEARLKIPNLLNQRSFDLQYFPILGLKGTSKTEIN